MGFIKSKSEKEEDVVRGGRDGRRMDEDKAVGSGSARVDRALQVVAEGLKLGGEEGLESCRQSCGVAEINVCWLAPPIFAWAWRELSAYRCALVQLLRVCVVGLPKTDSRYE